MKRRNFLAFGMAVVVVGCAPRTGRLAAGTRLILIRHADRAGDFLNSDGLARAQAMVGALEGTEIDFIYSPDIARNLETARPLSQARALPVTIIPSEFLLDRLATQAAGRTAIWIGNKGNLISTFEALGAAGPPPVNYGDMVILEPAPLGGISVQRLRVEI